MESVRHLVVGAGISGLATAAFLKDKDTLVLEAEAEIGGYCRTVKQDGFVWDYSGHFFHFKHPSIEAWLRARMPGQDVRVITKRSSILHGGRMVEFPFQKNIHQLAQPDFIECLHDLYFANHGTAPRPSSFGSFKEMLYARFGRGICEKFLIPYNEKLYATDLATLDPDAMGRFFPHASVADVIANMRAADNSSYNATFSYPAGGAIQYVNALASEVPTPSISLGERLLSVDVEARVAQTTRRQIRYTQLISSMPFPALLRATGLKHDPSVFSWNKVLVFNLGFDRKGAKDVHWVYYPDRSLCFYRVGYYDNIFNTDRLSIYVELGFSKDAPADAAQWLPRVLEDLKRAGVVDGHTLVSQHSVVLDPAYVHITRGSLESHKALTPILQAHGIWSIGRYGGWTYCSIEDNMVEARALASSLNARGELADGAPVLT